MLGKTLNGYQATFNDMAAQVVAQINAGQREINREFTPVIMSCMDPAYDLCTDERGIGSFKRMKDHMLRHVDQSKVSMFDDACSQVQNSLTALMGKSRKYMLEQVDLVYVGVQRDYMSIIGGVNVEQSSLPREERAVRREIDEVITAADESFQEIVGSKVEDLKEAHKEVVEDIEEMDVDDEDAVESEDSGGESSFEEDEGNYESEDNEGEESEGYATAVGWVDDEL